MPAPSGNDHYDVLVIGSGPGGATTAARAAETGKRVLLLERGDFLPRERDNWNSRAVFGDAKYTADQTFYDRHDRPFRPELAHRKLTLMTRTTAERLLTDADGRAVTGVAVTLPDGSPGIFTADIVVLSAGAILSAALLLRSADDNHPHGLANSSDLVGRNYMRHNNLALIAFAREPNPTVAHLMRDPAMPKIEDYALLGDLHTAALVSTAGSIDWLCLPRFDSPAAFAALLHNDESGHWTLAPPDASTCTSRRYAGNTLVLETDWVTADGAVRVVDFMPPRADTPHLVRIAVGLDGEVAMRSTLRLRFDYGRIVPWVRNLGSQVHAIAGPDRVRLMSAVPVRGDHWDTLADFTVRKGDRVPFVMSWAPGHDPQMPYVDAEQALSATEDFWTRWSAHAAYQPGPYRDAVDRSLITLKALTYAPTGGIVAAATTSLPEELGGVRNWDYRYCWLRDATYTLQALLAAGYRREAGAWRDWLLRAIAGQPETLQILYSLDGARRLPEAELPWLSGFEGSSPVRTGNAASGQRQLDVWGETLDALFLARQASLPADPDAWALQVALMNYLESAWREPDNGLWEVRGDRQHFTHSKVMAWAAADRMARSVREYSLPGPAMRWEALREQIHQDVVTHAFDAERNTFTQAYGSTALDASLLLIPRVGFLPAMDPRVLGTIAAVRRELSEGGLVRRYSTSETDDGVKGGEGLFIACSFWLVDALHASGQQQDAIELFERLLLLRNDVGLLSEEWDPGARRQLGNTPQAFSHFALVISALQLHIGGAVRSDNPMTV